MSDDLSAETPPPAEEEEEEEKKRPPFRLLAVAVVGVLAVILVLQNTETVETRIFFATVAMPRAVLLAVTFLLGVIAGLLIAFLRKRKD
jgi:uncharacterized integral membrane protein